MSSARPTRRFAHRVFLVFALALLAFSATFTTYFVRVQRQRLEAALVDRSRGLGGLLATGARIAVYSENAALVQETLSGVVDRQGMLSAAVFSVDGDPVATAGRTPALKEAAARLDPADLAVARLLGPQSGCLNHQDAAVLDAYCPVLLRERGTSVEDLYFEDRKGGPGQTFIGFVRVSLDRAPLRREIRQLVLRSLGLMALILLLGGWAGYRFARRVTEPLERLTEAVRVFGAGGEVGDLSRMPDDEIGRLAAAFTAMTRDLEERGREKGAARGAAAARREDGGRRRAQPGDRARLQEHPLHAQGRGAPAREGIAG